MKVSITHQDGMKFEAKTAKSSFIIDCPVISPVGHWVSTANVIPSRSSSGNSRLHPLPIVGASYWSRPMPCDHWAIVASSSLSYPKSWALGHPSTISLVLQPGFILLIVSIVRSLALYQASFCFWVGSPQLKQR